MRSTMNVSLPADLRGWVSEQVIAGGYGTASEYLRDLIRRARVQQTARRIDAALIEAVESGATIEMTKEDWSQIRRDARKALERSKTSRERKRSR